MLRRAALRPFALRLRRPLETAHGQVSRRAGFLVELEDGEGRCGYGEATPLPDFGTEDLDACRRALEEGLFALIRIGADLPSASLADSAAFRGGGAPCARSAIDSARVDLAAKGAARSLAREVRDRAGLVGEPESRVAVQALVGGGGPASVEESARTSVAAGFEAFKLKLAVSRGLRDPGLDLERVSALRGVIGSTARLRLDANEAWSLDEASGALAALEPFGIDYVEQPVERGDLVSLKRLSEEGAIRVAADESLLGGGLAACLEARAASILIAKPAAIGGLSGAIALWRRARSEGLQVVWSTLIDGAVGRAAPLALAAGLGSAQEVHGLGTAGLLATDLRETSSGDRLDARGRMQVSAAAGIGFAPVIPFSDTHADQRGSEGGAGRDGFGGGRGAIFEVEA
ncbi:MAG: o-succinylbenzoate synthase [Deltaproteobacteria bacterium]|nr:o-succinylbenzoate synthase [Deltaproteobacteria bacterium]